MSDKAIDWPHEYSRKQMHDWFQESTIHHHIKADGSHHLERTKFIADKAWKAAIAYLADEYTKELDKVSNENYKLRHESAQLRQADKEQYAPVSEIPEPTDGMISAAKNLLARLNDRSSTISSRVDAVNAMQAALNDATGDKE